MIAIYSTAPSSTDRDPAAFRQHAIDVARWTEAAGCRGLLVYTDNSLVDPWAAAQLMFAHTESLVPLVAVQPLYMHPFAVARMVSTLQFLHGRRVDLNFVTGGFAQHMRALGCTLSHDERYDRLREYIEAVRELMLGGRQPSYAGRYFQLDRTAMNPRPDPGLSPMIYLSGSSSASIKAQQALGVTRLAYPRLLTEYPDAQEALRDSGIRVGIIAREDAGEAWQEAQRRFPADRLGEQLHDVAARVVESHWHRDLSERAQRSSAPAGPYWLYPFRAYKTFCPYLVGNYVEVSEFLTPYLRHGVSTIVLDVPHTEEDMHHARIAIGMAAS